MGQKFFRHYCQPGQTALNTHYREVFSVIGEGSRLALTTLVTKDYSIPFKGWARVEEQLFTMGHLPSVDRILVYLNLYGFK